MSTLNCQVGFSGKRLRLPVQEITEMWVQSLGWEDPLEEEMAAPSSILAWKIPQTEEPDGLQPVGLQRVGHDWVTEHAYILWIEWIWIHSSNKYLFGVIILKIIRASILITSHI